VRSLLESVRHVRVGFEVIDTQRLDTARVVIFAQSHRIIWIAHSMGGIVAKMVKSTHNSIYIHRNHRT
jgi:triacylglycerol esterase/lipase EstA (alpha/beta hydrolase family)